MAILLSLLALAAIGTSLYAVSHQNFLFFHTIVELCSLGVVIAVFLLVWNARRFFNNATYALIAIGLLAAGSIDLLHTLSYKGLGVIHANGANTPTQFWIAARYLQALTLLTAPWLLRRRLTERAFTAVLAGFFLLTAGLIAAVMNGYFPDCYLPAEGLTQFKIISEYVIAAMLIASCIQFYRRRESVAPGVLVMLELALLAMIVSELAFTLYLDVYGIANVVGHFFKLTAAYLVYVALVRFGLTRPYDLLFRQQQEQERLLRMQRDLATQYLQAAQTIMLALTPTGRVKLINRRGCDVVGANEEDILGSDWINRFVPSEDRAHIRAVFEDLMTGRLACDDRVENQILTAAGERRTIVWKSSLLRGNDGQITGLLSSGEDVTEVRRAETEQKRLNAEMQQVQKYESLGALAGGIAHEFNNLLAAIMGNAELVSTFYIDGCDDAKDSLDHICHAARRGSRLTEQLLSYTGQCQPKKKQTNLAEIIRGMDDLLRMSVPKATAVTFDLAEDLPDLHLDPDQISQMLLGLVKNAGEAIGDKDGQIRIVGRLSDARCLPASLLQADPTLCAEACVSLQIVDNGCGMDKATLQRCCEPFFTTRFAGRGLGLSVVQGIVRSHGGTVHIDSTPDEGTTVTLLLPLSSDGHEGAWITGSQAENAAPAV